MNWSDILNKGTINNGNFSYEIINGLDIYKVNDQEFINSYVFSIGNHYCIYPESEFFLLSRFERCLARPLLYFMNKWFKILRLTKVIYINNQGLATNLYSEDEFAHLNETVKLLKEKYPDYTIIIRCLNNVFYKDLLKSFDKKWFPLLSRKIWFIKNEDYKTALTRSDVKKDKKLTEALLGNHVVKENDWFKDKPMSDPIWSKIQSLYSSLYLHKYSVHNPDFNKLWFYETCMSGLVQYTGLFDKEDNLKAIIGSYTKAGIYYIPILGYETDKIYLRAINYIGMAKVQGTNLHYHMSSGVGEYKKNRGATTDYEFQMVYLPKSFKNFFIHKTFKLLNFVLRKMTENKVV